MSSTPIIGVLMSVFSVVACGTDHRSESTRTKRDAAADEAPAEQPRNRRPRSAETEAQAADPVQDSRPAAPQETTQPAEEAPAQLDAPAEAEDSAWKRAPQPSEGRVAQVTAEINRWRTAPRVCGDVPQPAQPPLNWNATMFLAAWRHSNDLDTHRPLSGHYGSDGTDPGERMKDTGYRFNSGGENVATGFFDLAVVFDAWMKSPAHCVNIMAPYFSEFALSEINGVWTLVFGNPKP